MTQQGSGVIVFIRATPANGIAPTIAGLSAALAAVEGLTRCLATEWSPAAAGVRVVCVRSELFLLVHNLLKVLKQNICA